MIEQDLDSIAWYCLRSKPKQEHIAAAHLRQMRDVDVFSPRLRFQRSTVRGARWFVESMFPGYLFARFDFNERHREIRSGMGVTSILHFGNKSVRIHPSVIDELRNRTNADQIAVIESTFKEGDRVRIAEGALRGLEAVVTQFLSGKDRVRLLLDFLGREIQAEVRIPAVLPIRRHPLAE